MREAPVLQFRVLGPVEARAADQVLQLGPQQRLLLAALLAHANSVVPADALIDIVWGETPLADAATRLAKSVYRLRGAFASIGVGESVTTKSPGYLLSVHPEQLDAVRFERLLAQARELAVRDPNGALASLDSALALWHGPAWADVAEHEFIVAEVARLETLRAVAVEERCAALLTMGRYDELLPQLETITQRYPLRERPRAQQMLALYRTGRQADALAAYRGFRSYLLDEVGLEPSPDLRRLEDDILQQRDTAQVPSPVGWPVAAEPVGDRAPAGSSERFVGRRRDLEWLEVLFDRVVAGQPPVVAIVRGAPGIGKTALVGAFARLVRTRGSDVVFARCGESQSVAAAMEDALAGLSGDRRVLVVLDDLDITQAETATALDEIRSRRKAVPLMVIGTCRGGDDDPVPAPKLAVRTLAGLDPAGVAELLADVSGGARSADLVASVCAETGGAPALVTAVAQRLRDLDVAARADRALTRAAATRESWAGLRAEVAHGVLARGQLSAVAASDAQAVPAEGACPYKGLASFGVADAVFFFGRERMVADLVARLAVDRFVAVVGPSGSGKSSLVAAGMIPALQAGALPGSDRWPCRVIRPGVAPMRGLAEALACIVPATPRAIEAQLDADPGAIDAFVHRTGDCDETLVIVVDQFEEVFTACADPVARARFITAVTYGPAIPDSRILVAVALRADDYGACAEYPELARLLERGQLLVPPMTDADLRRVVLEPAWRAGLTVEDGVADAVVADAAGAPGALPLVSTALLETWVRRSKNTLTLAGYAQAGGVLGAVGHLADSVYDGLDPAGKSIARRIFLRLASPEGERTDVRRRAQRDELAGTPAEQRVLTTLIDTRLLTANQDAVEVAHEALLREWPRLRAWLDEDREGRRLHRHLADAALGWQADQRDDGGLYRGVRLHAAQEWHTTHPGDANLLETEFLTASQDAQDRGLRTARRRARRLRLLVVGLAALLAVSVSAGLLAVSQRSAARRQAALARTRQLEDDVNRMAGLAQTLPDEQRDLALLLGVQAYRVDPSDETAGGLQASLLQSPPGLDRIIRYPSGTFLPHLSRDGRLFAVGTTDGATVYDVATGAVVQTLHWPNPRQFAVLSGDNSLVAAGGFDGQISIWDTASGKVSGAPLRVGGNISFALFDPTDRDRIYAFTDTGLLTAWDRHDPNHPRQIGPTRYFAGGSGPDDPSYGTISADGRLLALSDASGLAGGFLAKITVWDLRTGQDVFESYGLPGTFGADGVTLPVVGIRQTVLYNVRTRRAITTIPTPDADGPATALSGDGRRLAVSVSGRGASAVQVYDVTTRQPIGAPLQLHGNDVLPVAFLPDGRLVISGNDKASIWTVGRTLPPLAVALRGTSGEVNSTVFMPHSNDVTTVAQQTRLLLRHNADTGAALGPLLAGRATAPFAPNPDRSLIAAAEPHTSTVRIWSSASGRDLAVLPGVPDTTQLAWSPNGRDLATDYGPTVQLWDTATPDRPTLVETIRNPHGVARPDYLLFSPDGRDVLTAAQEDRRVTLFDLARRRVQWGFQITDPELMQAAFSPDGRTLAINTGSTDRGSITLYDSTFGLPLRTLTTVSDGGVAFVHGGRWLIVTSNLLAPEAQLYDAKTLQPIGVPFSIRELLLPLAANDSGTKFSEPETSTPLVWDVDPADWIKSACGIAGRNLTHAEWHQYLPTLRYRTTCPQWPSGR